MNQTGGVSAEQERAAQDTHPQLQVGIYWVVAGQIIGDAVPLAQAEPYGDALQHGGHYEFWSDLQPESTAERQLKTRAYDFWPRGRLVFFPQRGTARLYVDPCLQNDDVDAVREFFGHSNPRIEIAWDEHYRCAECNHHYLD